MSELTEQGLLSLRGRGHRLKVENFIFANELMPLLGELDRALTLECKSLLLTMLGSSCQTEACCG